MSIFYLQPLAGAIDYIAILFFFLSLSFSCPFLLFLLKVYDLRTSHSRPRVTSSFLK
jgi:hypothetical protein